MSFGALLLLLLLLLLLPLVPLLLLSALLCCYCCCCCIAGLLLLLAACFCSDHCQILRDIQNQLLNDRNQARELVTTPNTLLKQGNSGSVTATFRDFEEER